MPVIDLGPVVGPQGPQGIEGRRGTQGPQGIPGPNQITTATSTTVNGILKGNGSVISAATVDDAPNALHDSNLVSSAAVANNTVPQYGMGKNLLDNWYFVGGGGAGQFPINQHGESSYSTVGVTYDRWKLGTSNRATVSTTSTRLVFTKAGSGAISLLQVLSKAVDGPCTFSVLLGTTQTGTANISIRDANGATLASQSIVGTSPSATKQCVSVTYDGSGNDAAQVHITMTSSANDGDVIQVYAAKFELGTQQTLCHNDGTSENPSWVLNELPEYTYELTKCQRELIKLSQNMSWRCAVYNSNDVYFYLPMPVTMRANPSIGGAGTLAVRPFGGSNQTGFTFSATSYSNAIRVIASKTSHGLTDSVLVTSGGDVLLSAEQ